MMTKDEILNLVNKNEDMMRIIRIVKSLNLPEWYIGAGFVRNPVWDYLSGHEKLTPSSDIDVVYFDTKNIDETIEKEYEKKLLSIDNKLEWSVKNQARMQIVNNKKYKNTEDAIRQWPETATAVAVRLNTQDEVELIAPHGAEDLTNMIVRRTPGFSLEEYQERQRKKNWGAKWPKLRFIEFV